eukprot:TRINITY_DN11364_c0_g1_i1.p1 TRINITY_DN11364_c0_g1~~TRINITY_DN11364_c0_g1_i1.p1  ORF type:complete len:208 (+),score=41.26 TRINITY_DN11364_c0_g1_i1:23-625(+)
MASQSSLAEQLSFYAAYHSDSTNKAIHIIFVPVILWTAFAMSAYVGPLAEMPPQIVSLFPVSAQASVVFNIPFVAAVLYCVYYTYLDFIAGGIFSLFIVFSWMSATHMANTTDYFYIFLAVHVVGWVFQFIGHGVFEGKRPALVDNIFQSFAQAPMFVWFEVLFSLGYRPSLHKEIRARTGKRIVAMKAGDAKRKAKKAF